MRLDEIRLHNFNCFEGRLVKLSSRFNLIVGDNATGKTTLLNAMAVGLGSLFLGFPPPAVAKGIHKDQARLKFFERGDAITAESQFPSVVSCIGAVNGEVGDWCRELTSEDGYKRRWEEKQQWYHEQEILPWNSDKKKDVRLITTRDDPRGGIDAAAIDRLIKEILK